MNKAAVQVFKFFLGKHLGVELLGHVIGICLILFLKNCQNVYLSGLTILHFQLQLCVSSPLLHALANRSIVSLSNFSPSNECVVWYFIVVLICNSLMINHVEYLFMGLLFA